MRTRRIYRRRHRGRGVGTVLSKGAATIRPYIRKGLEALDNFQGKYISTPISNRIIRYVRDHHILQKLFGHGYGRHRRCRC